MSLTASLRIRCLSRLFPRKNKANSLTWPKHCCCIQTRNLHNTGVKGDDKFSHAHNYHDAASLTSSAESVTFTSRTHLCGTLRSQHAGQEVILCGWLFKLSSGVFLKLYDWSGMVQVILAPEMAESLKSLNRETVLEVKGVVRKRPDEDFNPKMPTGEIEVVPSSIQVLNSCRKDIPFSPTAPQKVTEEPRLTHRYLDIRSKVMQRNLRMRSSVIMKMREYLCNMNGFIDVETPTLFRRTPGGAKEFLVPSRFPGKFYSLPQSPQQFKQLLMVGGIDRYFQVARCYRDEDNRKDRQPEFTQLDLEMSFIKQADLLNLIEGMMHYSWPSDLSPLPSVFPVMTFAEAMEMYGTDKPDTRIPWKLVDIKSESRRCGMTKVDKASSIKAFRVPKLLKHISKSLLDKIIKKESNFYSMANVLVLATDDQGQWRESSLTTKISKETLLSWLQTLECVSEDTVLIAYGDNSDVNKVLGKLRLVLAETLKEKGVSVYTGNEFQPLWIVDFPLFEHTEAGIFSAHHPFTAPVESDHDLLKSDPLSVRGQHYDLVLNGSEVGGGSIRIHDAELQEFVLTQILKEDVSELHHLLDALKSGCPPHGGIALGLDRMFAVMCNCSSIRDVIAFPKSASGVCFMSGAPTEVGADALSDYNIRVKDS